MTRPAPPGGHPPPTTARLADAAEIELTPLAHAICARYQAEFPDEAGRYGPAGQEWCVHDNLHLLAWAIADAELHLVDLASQVQWLARVLAARDFPLERLARDLDIAAEELAREHPRLTTSAAGLRRAADLVRGLPASV